jgi:hypothetical protein
VGSSTAGAAGGGGGGGGASGNPLMLVFLVQGIFMTSRLSDVPSPFADLTGGLRIFNLEVTCRMESVHVLILQICMCFSSTTFLGNL